MKYSVIVKEEPFESGSGLKTDKTAEVVFINDRTGEEKVVKYGYFDNSLIIERFSENSCLSLDGLYVKDFSLEACRSGDGTEGRTKVAVVNARDSFFDGKTNFSNVDFIKEARFSGSVFGNDDIDFSDCNFNCEVFDFNAVKMGSGNVSFRSATFCLKAVNFYSTNFGDGDMDFSFLNVDRGKLNFSGAIFGNGKKDFSYMTITRGSADFNGASFGTGDADFKNMNFSGSAVIFFCSSFTEGNVFFDEAVFSDTDVDFSFAEILNGDVSFNKTRFNNGSINFSNTDFGKGTTEFVSCGFKGAFVDFGGCSANKLIFGNTNFSEHVNMCFRKCNSLVIEKCIIEKTFDIKSTNKDKVSIDVLNIYNTKNLGQIFIDWDVNNVKKMIYSQGDDTIYTEKAEQFRLFKENFRAIGQYDDEDKAYVEFKRCERKAKIRGENIQDDFKKRVSIFCNWLLYPFKWFVLDFIGKYATDPVRVLCAMFTTIIVFTGLYMLPFVVIQGEKSSGLGDSPVLQKIMSSIYLSMTTAFTIGYGDVSPGNGWAVLLAALEGFSGMFLMSYFTVAFVRKILR